MWPGVQIGLTWIERKQEQKKCHVQGGSSEKTQNTAEKFRTREENNFSC